MPSESEQQRQKDTIRVMEVTIRLALVFGLIFWCFSILKPFLPTVVWAMIIAAALYPGYQWLLGKFNKSAGLTASLFTLAIVVLLLTPVLMLSTTLVETAQLLSNEFSSGQLQVPPAPESVKSWPLIGERVYDFWHLANENLSALLQQFSAQIKEAGRWLLSTAAGAGLGIAQFAVALLISGVFLAYSESGGSFARQLGKRIAGPRGELFAQLASSTVRSVAQGVLGVAFIQAMLAGMAFMALDVPGAGLWTLLVLILATVQLPAGLILIPSIFYVASTADTMPAVFFGAWMLMVSLIDNILKPLLLGRGASVPMLVIFLGAIGGFVFQGIVGLFIGAIVLSLGYELFNLWLNLDNPGKLDEALQPEQQA